MGRESNCLLHPAADGDVGDRTGADKTFRPEAWAFSLKLPAVRAPSDGDQNHHSGNAATPGASRCDPAASAAPTTCPPPARAIATSLDRLPASARPLRHTLLPPPSL